MSVVVVVKVSEGLVLGADSAATLHGQIVDPQGHVQEGVLKTYFNARKLLQIGDYPIGVLTWGTAFIGLRTIESIVREWEYRESWQFKAGHKEKHGGLYTVEDCADSLKAYLTKVYTAEYNTNEKPILGFVVAGYSQDKFFPEIWRFILPIDIDGEIHNQRPDKDGKPDFGAHWFGETDAIVRLHFGRDERVASIMAEKYGLDPTEVMELLRPLEYQIPFAVMPLQDAIEYTNYVLNVVIGRYRFVIGPESCGGQIEIAAITQRQFSWISRKRWSLDGAS